MRSLSNRTILLVVLAVVAAEPAVAQRQPANRAADVIDIPFEKFTLPNGLTVILAPEHSTPTLTVDVWYYVGSKNEAPGRTGFAHLFEHVMFTGSGNAAYGLHDRLTNGVGGENNGTTNEDRTMYYESVPSNYLESTLWLEADRMGFLLDKLDSAKFIAQRDIVQNERRQRIENQPYGRASEIINSALYPTSNPYSWPVVGYMTDLQAASLDDVKRFFRLYYAPANATLSIVGDFDPAEAKRLVTKYFSDLPRGKAIARPAASPPRLTTEKRLTFEDRVQVPTLYIRWPTVGRKHDDSYVLNVLAAVLTSGRTARLTKALVYEKQLATNVFSGNLAREALGDFGVQATPRAGQSLTAIETTIDSVLARFKHEGPTAEEIQRATAGLERDFVLALESNIGKAEMLNTGQVYHNDPGYFKKEYVKYRSVTAADVKRVANTYLGAGRVVLSIVPLGRIDMASRAESSVKVTVTPDARYIMENK